MLCWREWVHALITSSLKVSFSLLVRRRSYKKLKILSMLPTRACVTFFFFFLLLFLLFRPFFFFDLSSFSLLFPDILYFLYYFFYNSENSKFLRLKKQLEEVTTFVSSILLLILNMYHQERVIQLEWIILDCAVLLKSKEF